MKTKPMTMLLAMLAGWINQQQREVVEHVMRASDGQSDGKMTTSVFRR